MPPSLIAQGQYIAIFWLFLCCFGVIWGGTLLFLPRRRHLHRSNRKLSRIERHHASKFSQVRHKKSRRYKLIGLTAMLGGAFGIFFAIKFVLESEF